MRMSFTSSGGLSGGISSAIAGGDFWDGVKQGLITSGLNEVAHAVIKMNYASQVRRAFEKYGGQTLTAKDRIRILVEEVASIRRIHRKAGSPGLETIKISSEQYGITTAKEKTLVGTAHTVGTAHINFLEGEFISYEKIVLYQAAIAMNNYGLGLTLSEELYHVYQAKSGIHTGFYQEGFSLFGSHKKADEFASYHMEMQVAMDVYIPYEFYSYGATKASHYMSLLNGLFD